ncbi:MAG TPA: RNA polymerase sigma factor [Pirellulales bacterium]|nr:RNA polymerase sigma factor [Pirellulales bacterium]
MECEEQALREAVLAGNETAWRALYERTFPAVYAFVFHRAGRHSAHTDEIVQETWLIAVRKISQFDPGQGSFEGWLKGIAENVLKNHRRRWRREPRAELTETSGNFSPDGGDALGSRDLLALALTALPSRYEAVLRAKYLDQLSVAEIAGRLGGTPKAIESLLSRARAAFRQIYQGLNGE